MKIVHISDSHLGFSNFGRVDRKGRNLVEEMIYKGFDKAIEKIISLKPDAVVHAGDVFHHVRPKIRPLFIFKKGLERLSEAGIPVVVISGNHDSPKSYSSTSPFVMFDGQKDVMIAHSYRYEPFEVGDHTFHCIPFCNSPDDYVDEYGKIQRSGSDVLVMHGMVEAMKHKRLMTVGEHEIKDSLLKSDLDYIALGHYHGQGQVSGNAWYSGSIEYFNFGEAEEKKGMLLVDLKSGRVESIRVRPKYMIDIQSIDCSGLSSDEIITEIESAFNGYSEDVWQDDEGRDDPGWDDMNVDWAERIMRVNLSNVDRSSYRMIDHAKLNRLTSRSLYTKIKVEYVDGNEGEEIKESVDALHIPDEFGRFMEDEAEANRIPKAIREDVMAYGKAMLQRIILERNTDAMDSPK